MHKIHYSSAESSAVQFQRVPENIFLTGFHDNPPGFIWGNPRHIYGLPDNLRMLAKSRRKVRRTVHMEDQVRTVQERVAHGLCQRLAFCYKGRL
jgi:hypothetical protein